MVQVGAGESSSSWYRCTYIGIFVEIDEEALLGKNVYHIYDTLRLLFFSIGTAVLVAAV